MLTRQQQGKQSSQSRTTSAAAAANDRNSPNANDAAVTQEIQSSIKEVTSAIVHFVNDQSNRVTSTNSRSRSTSPSSKYVFMSILNFNVSCLPYLKNDFSFFFSNSIFVEIAG